MWVQLKHSRALFAHVQLRSSNISGKTARLTRCIIGTRPTAGRHLFPHMCQQLRSRTCVACTDRTAVLCCFTKDLQLFVNKAWRRHTQLVSVDNDSWSSCSHLSTHVPMVTATILRTVQDSYHDGFVLSCLNSIHHDIINVTQDMLMIQKTQLSVMQLLLLLLHGHVWIYQPIFTSPLPHAYERTSTEYSSSRAAA